MIEADKRTQRNIKGNIKNIEEVQKSVRRTCRENKKTLHCKKK